MSDSPKIDPQVPVKRQSQRFEDARRVLAVLCVEAPNVHPRALGASLAAVAQEAKDQHLEVLPGGRPALTVTALGATDLRRIGLVIQQSLARRCNGTQCWVGIGTHRAGSEGIGAARRQAEEAITYGRRAWCEPRVVMYEDAALGTALRSDPRARDLLVGILAPLESHGGQRGSRLLLALEAFFDADLSARGAAKRLGVHRHTLEQRLREAERVLGRSIRKGPDRLLVEAALRARRFRKTPLS